MKIKENLKRALRSNVAKTLVGLTTAVSIPLAGWAGFTYAHNMQYGPYEESVASEMLDEIKNNDNLAKRALAVGLYPLARAQDAGNNLYRRIHE